LRAWVLALWPRLPLDMVDESASDSIAAVRIHSAVVAVARGECADSRVGIGAEGFWPNEVGRPINVYVLAVAQCYTLVPPHLSRWTKHGLKAEQSDLDWAICNINHSKPYATYFGKYSMFFLYHFLYLFELNILTAFKFFENHFISWSYWWRITYMYFWKTIYFLNNLQVLLKFII
jgi:hypothetical protein